MSKQYHQYFCDELITRPGESCRLWYVVVCDLESSWKRRPWPTGGASKPKPNRYIICRSQWPHGLRSGSAAARLLRLWVRIPPGAWMFVCCDCCVLSGRGLCVGLITRPEESYPLWWVVVCHLENSWMRRPWPTGGCRDKTNKQYRG